MFRLLSTAFRPTLITRTLSNITINITNILKPGSGSSMSKKPSFYVVSHGYKPGIYQDHQLAYEQIVGFQHGFYKKFGTYDEAYNYFFNTRHTDTGFKRSADSRDFDVAFQAAVEQQKLRERTQEDIEDVVSTFCNVEKRTVPVEEPATRAKRARKETKFTDDLEDLEEFESYLLSSLERDTPEPARKRRYCGGGRKKKERRDDTGAAVTKGGVPIVYIDGCCLKQGSLEHSQAGIGVFWGIGDERNLTERLWGPQTNQRAELWAAVRAIQTALQCGYQTIEIHTDSQYLISSMTLWIAGWKQRGWKLSQGNKDVKNKDIMVLLDNLVCYIDVTWVKVKGHSNVHGNEMADQLAKCGAHLSHRNRPSLNPENVKVDDGA